VLKTWSAWLTRRCGGQNSAPLPIETVRSSPAPGVDVAEDEPVEYLQVGES
jgi:hypothetical protein